MSVIPIGGGAGGVEPPLSSVSGPRPTGEKTFAQRVEAAEAGPPPEVRDEVRAAARAANRLHELGRELRFEVGGEGERLRIEVRDLDGRVLRTVPPDEVFDFAGGRRTG